MIHHQRAPNEVLNKLSKRDRIDATTLLKGKLSQMSEKGRGHGP